MRRTDKHTLRPRNLRIVTEADEPSSPAAVLPDGFKTIVLVSCAKRKRSHTCEAKDLYDSDLFRLARQYAEREGDAWYILSARHYLTDPERLTDPYDQSLKDSDPEWRTSWANLTAHRLAARITGPTRLVVLASTLYTGELLQFLRRRVSHPLETVEPLKGLGIGRRMAWLRHRLDEMDAEERDLEEAARLAFNPEGMIDVALPSGAVARVSPDISPETLGALDRMCALAAGQFMEGADV